MLVRKVVYTVLLTLGLVGSNMASATVMADGNKFLEYYNDNASTSKTYLYGYVAGWYDQYEATHPELSICVGADVRMSQLVDSVAIYLQKNPQVRHHHPSTFILTALKTQFSCND